MLPHVPSIFRRAVARTAAPRASTLTLAFLVVAALGACGGGGGGSSPPPPFSVSNLGAWPTLAAQCAAPRSGVDPYNNNQPYPDRKGTLLNEQDWLASWTDDTYLWYSDFSYPDPTGYATAINYFDVLKTPLTTPSGKSKDHFHFTYPTSVWEALSTSGVQAGYGATWSLVSAFPPRQAVVAYTEPNSPATTLSPALARGAQILFVDGVDLVNDNTQAGVNILNAGLFPATVGESHIFVVQDLAGNPATRTFTMTSAAITSAPVQNVSTLTSATPGSVGYMLFNDHLATAEPALIAAISQFKTAAITDLIVDIRYNGGGYLDIASELAYMIAGPGQTSGKTFDQIKFNAKHPSVDPVLGTPIAPTPFNGNTLGFTPASSPAGQALPYLGLSTVYVLTGSGTCSASEAVINGLRGAGVTVIQIGSTTCGKPYGFYPADNCGTTYFSIQFQGVNQAGFGNYPDGFVPQNGATTGIDTGAILPGCSVADDFTHNLGDPAEARVATALSYRDGLACPAPTGLGALPGLRQSLAATEGKVYKSVFLSNRIMGKPIKGH
jgi:C-terminal processing protease CtpA/Prc